MSSLIRSRLPRRGARQYTQNCWIITTHDSKCRTNTTDPPVAPPTPATAPPRLPFVLSVAPNKLENSRDQIESGFKVRLFTRGDGVCFLLLPFPPLHDPTWLKGFCCNNALMTMMMMMMMMMMVMKMMIMMTMTTVMI